MSDETKTITTQSTCPYCADYKVAAAEMTLLAHRLSRELEELKDELIAAKELRR